MGVPPRTGKTAPTRPQPASVNGAGGSRDADLRISKTPWTSAARVADGLHSDTGNGLSDLRETGIGTAAGAVGFECPAALNEVRATWEARLTAVRDECGRLRETLAATGKHFGEVDHHVAGRVGGVPVGSTPNWAR